MNKTLVFLNTTFSGGHEADMRASLQMAFGKDAYAVFHDLPKRSENIFSKTIEEILVSGVVLLDGIQVSQKIASDILIQYGICCSLSKKVLLLSVRFNSSLERGGSRSPLIESYIERDYYLDIQKELKKDIQKQLNPCKLTIDSSSIKKPAHAFSVFGVDQEKSKDVHDAVSKFADGTGWHIKFHSSLGDWSQLSSLARDIGARSFCVFYLNEDNHQNIFIGIGLAIGMGRPFLILKETNTKLPKALKGYDGVLEYEGYSDLLGKIKKYSSDFLSDEVFYWRGATYNSLLDRIEKNIGGLSKEEFNKTEYILHAITNVPALDLAQSYALLGDLYREKNKLSPDDKNLLIDAKDFYMRALSIQPEYPRCEDAVGILEKHIELIEFIREKKFHSIPRLINKIGKNLTTKEYFQVRDFLIGIVKELIEQEDYLHAISLLAVLQIHDKTKQIQDLIQDALGRAPFEAQMRALQDAQQYIIELENEKKVQADDIKDKEIQIGSLLSQTETLSMQCQENEEIIQNLNVEKSEINKELKNINSQFLAVQESNRKLEEMIMDEGLKKKLESTWQLDGRGVIVNIGFGWAIFHPLSGIPYVVRNGSKFLSPDSLPYI